MARVLAKIAPPGEPPQDSNGLRIFDAFLIAGFLALAFILGLKIPNKGKLVGRVIAEAMPQGKTPTVISRTLRSAPSVNGLRTILVYQQVGLTRYSDVAGFPGRTVGLAPTNR